MIQASPPEEIQRLFDSDTYQKKVSSQHEVENLGKMIERVEKQIKDHQKQYDEVAQELGDVHDKKVMLSRKKNNKQYEESQIRKSRLEERENFEYKLRNIEKHKKSVIEAKKALPNNNFWDRECHKGLEKREEVLTIQEEDLKKDWRKKTKQWELEDYRRKLEAEAEKSQDNARYTQLENEEKQKEKNINEILKKIKELEEKRILLQKQRGRKPSEASKQDSSTQSLPPETKSNQNTYRNDSSSTNEGKTPIDTTPRENSQNPNTGGPKSTPNITKEISFVWYIFGFVVRWLLYIALVGTGIYFLYPILKTLFQRTTIQREDIVAPISQNVYTEDQLEKLVKDKQYLLACSYLFQKAIEFLIMRQAISTYFPHLTNNQIITQISNPHFKKHIDILGDVIERGYYAEETIGEQDFEKCKKSLAMIQTCHFEAQKQ